MPIGLETSYKLSTQVAVEKCFCWAYGSLINNSISALYSSLLPEISQVYTICNLQQRMRDRTPIVMLYLEGAGTRKAPLVYILL